MSIILFEGPAGTGKTTRLVSRVKDWLVRRPLGPDERVLGLTKYHGSRKRMHSTLAAGDCAGTRVDCLTIASFGWNLVRRLRTLARSVGPFPAAAEFSRIAEVAARLLRYPWVGTWLARRYPLVVLDEMQDCTAEDLAVLEALEPHVECVAAADKFQDLSGAGESPAVDWASSIGEVIALHEIHRTRVRGLRAASEALRTGHQLNSAPRDGFEVVEVASPAQGGGVVSWRIKNWTKHGQIVVLSPRKRADQKPGFVDKLVTWVSEKQSQSKRGGGRRTLLASLGRRR